VAFDASNVFVSVASSRLFFAVPFVDSISYVIDMRCNQKSILPQVFWNLAVLRTLLSQSTRLKTVASSMSCFTQIREKAIEIEPQMAITKDNVSLFIAGNVFVQFDDPRQAAYGSFNPLYAVKQNAQSSMRSAIGHMELDEILHAREKINSRVQSDLSTIVADLGLKCKRYEITQITPDKHIADAMDRQAAAERSRREQIKGAEGDKQSAVLQSEGYKIKLINESEGYS
jgi:regulator of protease activity HflC (stomatin/prohibitin superfamily)